MLPKNIPDDINIEVLLSYLKERHYKVALKGLHKRNAYNDIIDIEERHDGTMYIDIGRNSIYNTLPEYLFHPIDRFNNQSLLEGKEKFIEEYEKQEQEKDRALHFFAPIDLQLLLLKMEAREDLRSITETNKVLIDVILDEQHQLSDEQLANRFIMRALPFLTSCKYIRGNKTYLTIFLRKVLLDEGLNIEIYEKKTEYSDLSPRYADGLNGTLDECFVGNVYDESVITFDIHYWPDDCDEQFLQLVEEIDIFRRFVNDYFLSIEEVLQFNITKNATTLRLSDNNVYNYLDYNTNI